VVTMSEVARVANVSQTTVSHVINKTRKVNPETERVVLEAIEATGYSGDEIARSLRTGTTQTIGLAMSAISNPYFGDVVHAMERGATEKSYTLLLTDTHDDPDQELRAVRDLVSHRVDAVVLAPSAEPDRVYELLAARKVPLVLVDRVPDETRPGVDAIGVSNVEPVATLVDHLAGHGHRRIAIVAPRRGIITTNELIAGYLLGLERNGIAPDEALIVHGGSQDDDATDRAIASLLQSTDPPTALVLGNNVITVAAIAALRRRGIVPPEGMATASFDDFAWADFFRPRLTAMSQPVDMLGTEAIRMLLERIAEPGLAARHKRLDPVLQVRESCGCT
jgi:LacI family transcriptional regulator